MFFTRIERFWVEKNFFSKKNFWMIQKILFEKISESTQNRSIRKINIFWAIFEILTFFLKEPPRLCHFSTKKWNFRFWPSLAILTLLVTQVDLIMQNQTVEMTLNNFFTFRRLSIFKIKHFQQYFKVYQVKKSKEVL